MTIHCRDISVWTIMERWPETLGVFIQYRMLCIGWAVAPFHTVSEACAEHDLDEATICAELDRVIAASGFGSAQ